MLAFLFYYLKKYFFSQIGKFNVSLTCQGGKCLCSGTDMYWDTNSLSCRIS